MEVHAHTHTPRKKWTHYFWEFLMLFLAVFCGFLAEYYLEHKIEHNRERQFIHSLIKDIESDTVQLSLIKGFRLNRLDKMDSLQYFLSKKYSSDLPPNVYHLMEDMKGHLSFYQNSGTLDQLKNSGGLRLIRKRRVVDSIQKYDQQIKHMLLRDNFEAEEMRYTMRLSYKLVDGVRATRSFGDTSYVDTRGAGVYNDLPIYKQYMGEYLNSLITYRFIVLNNMHLQESIRSMGESLLLVLKKEYRLE